MVHIISDVIEKQILSEMTKSEHFSIMLDETTDCSVTEQLAIHGRYISRTTGELKSHYLKVIDLLHAESGDDHLNDVSVHAGAETITNRVCGYMEQASLNTANLRGIGTDGASTMVGCHTGVVTRLQAIQPSAIGVHCAAHRLNLAASQAGDSVQYIKHFKSILRQIFDNSAVRMAGLDAIKELLGEKGRLEAPSTTRWLSIEHSVNKLKVCFASVVLSLEREGEERSDARAIGLYGLITQFRFVCTMLLLCDCLPHVSRMSKCFQMTECDYSIIPKILESTLSSLEQLKTCHGTNLSGLQQYLDNLQQKDIEIKKPPHLSEDYFNDKVRMPFLSSLIDNMHKRFPNTTLLASFDIFNPRKIPNDDNLIDFGNAEIATFSEM